MSETTARKLGQLITQWYDATADRFRPASRQYPLPVDVAGDIGIAKYNLLFGHAAKNIAILGRRTTFAGTTPFQDVATYLVGGQSALNAVAVGTTYYVVSTSASDVAGSAGVSKVRIYSLDASGNPQVTSATLNGTTKVSIGSGYTAFQWMESSEMGTGGVAAAGNIAIFSGAGAAAAEGTTVEQILAGGNRSLSGRFTIPTGYKGYLMGWRSSAPGSQAMDVRLRAECFSDDRAISPGIFHFQSTQYNSAGGSNSDEDLHAMQIPAGAMIKVSVYPAATTGTPRVDVNFHLTMVRS